MDDFDRLQALIFNAVEQALTGTEQDGHDVEDEFIDCRNCKCLAHGRGAACRAVAFAKVGTWPPSRPAITMGRSASTLSSLEEEDMPLIPSRDRQDSSLRGEDYGASISLILDESEPGQGPRLHRHAYDETWVIQEGRITFQAGDERFHAGPGDVAIIPPGVPHKFTNDGPGPSKIVCIHASPRIVGEWLE